LSSRLVSRELDHSDPFPGRYTLEVTSPGLERTLRTPQHFQREVGKTIAVRLLEARDGRRRLQGPLIRANDTTFVMCLEDTGTEQSVRYADVERARVVFVWGAEASPSSGRSTSKKNIDRSASSENTDRSASNENKEVV
jgi:ribosome maturation factor RimP